MKNNVTPRFSFLLLLLAYAGIGYAAQGINFNYVKPFNCIKPDKSVYLGNKIVQDDSGYVYTYFTLDDTTDMDPSAGTQYYQPQTGAYNTMCIAKLTPAGELVWVKNIVVDVYSAPSNMVLHNNALYLFGNYRQNADFDPNAGTAYLSGNGTQNTPFVAKYTLNGDYVFAKNMAISTSDVYISDVTVNSFHRIIVVGAFAKPTDFDPTVGTLNLDPVADGYYDGYVASYDTDFTSVGAYRIAGGNNTGGTDWVTNVAVDGNDNIYLGGFSASSPVYPDFFGQGNPLSSGAANGNGFVAKYNNLFQLQWAGNFNSTATTTVDNIVVWGSSVYLNVRCDGGLIDFDPGVNASTVDFNALPGHALVVWNTDGSYAFHKAWHANTGIGDYIGFSSLAVSYNRILISGNYRGAAIDLDPNVPLVNAAATTTANPFIMLLDGAGSLVQHVELSGSAATTVAATFSKQSDQYFYYGGMNSDTTVFGTGAQSEMLVAGKSYTTTYNSFLARYDLLDIPPDTASNTMVFSDVTDTTMHVSFAAGNGEKRLVICRAINPVDAQPADAIYHSANSIFGIGYDFGGQYAVYNDVSDTFTLTGLTPNTMYYFEVFEYNGVSSQINYLTASTLTGNHKTTLNGSTGIAGAEENSWKLYPNPAKNYILLQAAGLTQNNSTIQIVDVTGKTVLQSAAETGNTQHIDISALTAGVYFMQVKNSSGVQTYKFIKE